MPDSLLWPSGVGGSQCDECGETTIVRGFDRDLLDYPTRYLCRECVEGNDDDLEVDRV